MIRLKCFLIVFICSYTWNGVFTFPSTTESLVIDTGENSPKDLLSKEANDGNDLYSTPRITEMRVISNVSNRFAHTIIRSKVKNFSNSSKEATFSVVLPDSAYISGFIMEIDGKNYTAYVKEKEEAKKIYNEAVASGIGAAHVAVDTRDSNIFTVSVNVEPESKAVFYLTYEELLNRQNGYYELVINIRPGQPVKDLGVEVKLAESRPIKNVKTPPLRTGNEIGSDKEELDPRANVELINSTSAIITFNPSIQRQKELAKQLGTEVNDGLAGQFIVQYDVERDPLGGEVLLDDGYFVHFFAPSELDALPKHVVFVLDTSGSMFDRKITQLKEAMNSILEELKSSDKFNLVEFNTDVKVWDLQNGTESTLYPPGGASWAYEGTNVSLKDIRFPPAYSVNQENIEKAKKTVSGFEPNGGTNINDALKVALHLIETERNNNESSDKLQPLIIFLTDGEPTVGVYNTDQIVAEISEFNQGKRRSVLFSLSFGEAADKKFLQKLALHNSGFSKQIYEGADASLQLQGFYKQISSPLLANVTFKYVPTVSGVTKTVFPILFNGSEIVVAGRYEHPPSESTENGKDLIASDVVAFCGTGLINLKPVYERPVTGLQRIWAYLTVKQLLEEKEISKNSEELKKKALAIALQHSFVTSVSSLVVVKPNETKPVDAESTQNAQNRVLHFQSSMKASFPLRGVPLSLPNYAGAGASASLRTNYNALFIPQNRVLHFQSSMKASFPLRGVPLSLPNYAGSGVAFRTTPVSAFSSYDPVAPIAYDSEDSAITLLPRAEDPISSFSWLKSELSENGTIHFPTGDFELSFNATVSSEVCSNAPPLNASGNCTLLNHCDTASTFLFSMDDLKIYFCPLEKYIGVCCPDIP